LRRSARASSCAETGAVAPRLLLRSGKPYDTARGSPPGRDGVDMLDMPLATRGTIAEADTRRPLCACDTDSESVRTRRIDCAVLVKSTVGSTPAAATFNVVGDLASPPDDDIVWILVAPPFPLPPPRPQRLRTLRTTSLASVLALAASTFCSSTSFHGLLSTLSLFLAVPSSDPDADDGGRFSSSSSSPTVPSPSPGPLTPAPTPGLCSSPTREKWSCRSLMLPRSWTDSRLAADREMCRYLGFFKG
jgi:hypothetical protein